MDKKAVDPDRAVSLDVELVPFEDDKGRFGCRVSFLGTKSAWFTRHHDSVADLTKHIARSLLEKGSSKNKKRPQTLRVLKSRTAEVIRERPQARDLRPADLSDFCTDLHVLLDWPVAE